MNKTPSASDQNPPASADAKPELEITPTASDERERDELPYRLRQQSLLGDFGRFAMQSRDLGQILQRAADLCAEGLKTPYAKVLEFVPEQNRLELRAGVGWEPGTIDHVTLGADLESPAGYAYHTGQSVISNHLHEEARFRTPKLLSDHGVKRAINVLIERGNASELPYASWRSTVQTPASATVPMQTSSQCLQVSWASPSNANRPTPSSRRRSSIKPC